MKEVMKDERKEFNCYLLFGSIPLLGGDRFDFDLFHRLHATPGGGSTHLSVEGLDLLLRDLKYMEEC